MRPAAKKRRGLCLLEILHCVQDDTREAGGEEGDLSAQAQAPLVEMTAGRSDDTPMERKL